MACSEMTTERMRELAREMAGDNADAEPDLKAVYWFPDADNEELRLVDVLENTGASGEEIEAFHFGANTKEGVPVPMALALIRPEEVKNDNVRLPEGWCGWDEAERVFPLKAG